MPRRYYSNLATPTSLSSGIDDDDTTISVPSTAGYPSVPFTIAIARGTPNEEIVLVQAKSSNQFSDCIRGYDSTPANDHLAGVSIEHVVAAIDYTEWAEHIYNTALDHHTQYLNTARHAAIDHGPIIADLTVPVGGIIPYFGTAAPNSRWLLCTGQAVSRTTYSALFAVIGTTAGAGDGLSTFNVPDMRGRVPVGLDNMGGASANIIVDGQADVLGGMLGAEAITLSATQIPAHSHGAGSLVTSTTGSHRHGVDGGDTGFRILITNSPSTIWIDNPGPSGDQEITYSQLDLAGNHSHSITGNTASVGGGSSHNNVQPSRAMAYLIRAS